MIRYCFLRDKKGGAIIMESDCFKYAGKPEWRKEEISVLDESTAKSVEGSFMSSLVPTP